jgi:hypothetical protein
MELMKSPFPGMDPYLESRWADVHPTLITFIKECIQPLLPRDLRARSEERVLLEDLRKSERVIYRSDVAVVETGRSARTATAITGNTTLEPVLVEFYDDPETERFVQIIDTSSGNRVVTAIEVVSPWNKGPGPLNKKYCKKIADYRRAEVNIVEIDLLRDPRRGRMEVGQEDLPQDRREPYLACIWRANYPSRWEVYPISLRQPLPSIPVPLRSEDTDVALDLQPLIERLYIAGGHDDIDYREAPYPALRGDDAVWADAILHAAGKR